MTSDGSSLASEAHLTPPRHPYQMPGAREAGTIIEAGRTVYLQTMDREVTKLHAAESKLIGGDGALVSRPIHLALLMNWSRSRSIVGQVVPGGVRRSESTRAWSDVWARRREWLAEEVSA